MKGVAFALSLVIGHGPIPPTAILQSPNPKLGMDEIAQLEVGATVRALCFSGDNLFAAGNAKSENRYALICWSLKNKQVMLSIKTDFETYVSSLNTSPASDMILAADRNGNIGVYSVEGKKIARFKMFERGGAFGSVVNTVLDVKLVDNETALTVAFENIVTIRNVTSSGSKMYYLKSGPPDCASYSVASDTLVWSDEYSVYTWKHLRNQESVPTKMRIPIKQIEPRSISVSADGSSVVVASGDSEMLLYDTTTGTIVKKWNGHNRMTLHALVAIAGNKGYATACADEVKVWDSKGHLLAVHKMYFEKDSNEEVSCIAADGSGTMLAVGTRSRIFLFDLKAVLNK